MVDDAVPRDADPDGGLTVEIGVGDSYDPALDLAAYAAHLEVLEPPQVRDRLAEIGARLVARYAAAE